MKPRFVLRRPLFAKSGRVGRSVAYTITLSKSSILIVAKFENVSETA
jgi:hypothetical protein